MLVAPARGRRPRRNPQSVPSSRQNQTRKTIRQNTKQINSTGVFQIGKNRQILSVPSHQYNLKIRKHFRIVDSAAAPSTQPGLINLDLITSQVRRELGLAAPTATTGELFVVFGYKAYVALAASTQAVPISSVNIDVLVYDIKQGSASGNVSNLVANFSDTSSHSSVAHSFGVFPLNDRPTFNAATANTNLLIVGTTSVNSYRIVVDMDISYVRTTVTSLTRSLFQNPNEISGNDIPQNDESQKASNIVLPQSSAVTETATDLPTFSEALRRLTIDL